VSGFGKRVTFLNEAGVLQMLIHRASVEDPTSCVDVDVHFESTSCKLTFHTIWIISKGEHQHFLWSSKSIEILSVTETRLESLNRYFAVWCHGRVSLDARPDRRFIWHVAHIAITVVAFLPIRLLLT
jgi:hypothetical protein